MQTVIEKFCPANLFFICSILLFAAFCSWLAIESTEERLRRVFITHERLILEGKKQEASDLFYKTIEDEGEGALDPLFIQIVNALGNGYDQLSFFLRIMAYDPARESTYKAIAELIEFAPKEFHDEVKQTFFDRLAAIEGIEIELLEQYGLTMATNQKELEKKEATSKTQ